MRAVTIAAVSRRAAAPMVPIGSSSAALPTDSVAALLAALDADQVPRRRTDWIERDRALILTALLAGLRADELVRASVGDLSRTDDGAVIHVRGKGGKDRRIPIEPALVVVLERYLDSRAARFPAAAKRPSPPAVDPTAHSGAQCPGIEIAAVGSPRITVLARSCAVTRL